MKKKRNAFTLIELLAVIVVLAIIALIATPIVMNTIKNAKKGAAERTADNYIKQVETAVAEAKLENKSVPNGTYNIDGNGNLTGAGLPDGKLEINMSGNKPTSGTVTIKNGGVSQDGTTMTVGDYIVSYDKDNNKQIAQELYKGILCKAVTTATTGNVPSGNYAYGDEYTCELGDNDEKTFFVLETNGDNVSLIMNKNIDSNGKGTTSGNTVAWVSKEDYIAAGGEDLSNDEGYCQKGDMCAKNEYGPITAQKYLKNSTTSWTKLTESQISLPTSDQIYKAAGNKTSGLSTWLYGNLNYWTSTPYASNSYAACFVSEDGRLFGDLYGDSDFLNVDAGDSDGVRPVITVSKSQLG